MLVSTFLSVIVGVDFTGGGKPKKNPSKHGKDQLQQLYSHARVPSLRINMHRAISGHSSSYNHIWSGLTLELTGETHPPSVLPIAGTCYSVACNISNTRKSVSSGYPNPEKCVEKRGRRPSFLTITSRCLDNLMKHSSECLI